MSFFLSVAIVFVAAVVAAFKVVLFHIGANGVAISDVADNDVGVRRWCFCWCCSQ